MPVDRTTYRAIAGAFPTGVAVVTTVAADGAPRGLTTQSFVGISTEPPLVLVSIDKTSRTLPDIQGHRAFVINFLKQGHDDVSDHFASKKEEKFTGISWRPSAIAGGAPVLEDAIVAYAECVVEQAIEAGDHWLFIARVDGGAVLEGAPLMYYRRTYAGWPLERDAPAL